MSWWAKLISAYLPVSQSVGRSVLMPAKQLSVISLCCGGEESGLAWLCAERNILFPHQQRPCWPTWRRVILTEARATERDGQRDWREGWGRSGRSMGQGERTDGRATRSEKAHKWVMDKWTDRQEDREWMKETDWGTIPEKALKAILSMKKSGQDSIQSDLFKVHTLNCSK